MTKGSAPIAMLRKSVDTKTWATMEKIALDHIEKSITNFPTSLTADSWIGSATKKDSSDASRWQWVLSPVGPLILCCLFTVYFVFVVCAPEPVS